MRRALTIAEVPALWLLIGGAIGFCLAVVLGAG